MYDDFHHMGGLATRSKATQIAKKNQTKSKQKIQKIQKIILTNHKSQKFKKI